MGAFSEEEVVKLLELLRTQPAWDPTNVGANMLATSIRETFHGYWQPRGHSSEYVLPSVRGILPMFEMYLRYFQ